MSIFNDKPFLLLPMKYFVGKKFEWQISIFLEKALGDEMRFFIGILLATRIRWQTWYKILFCQLQTKFIFSMTKYFVPKSLFSYNDSKKHSPLPWPQYGTYWSTRIYAWIKVLLIASTTFYMVIIFNNINNHFYMRKIQIWYE